MKEIKSGAFTPVTKLRGVGEKRAKSFSKLGIENVGQLILHFPRAYEYRGNVKMLAEATDGELCAFILCVAAPPKSALIRRGMTITKLNAVDETGKCEITFFNQAYIKDVLREGAYFRFYGRIKKYAGKCSLSSPAFEPLIPGRELRPLVPVYPLTSGLSQKFMSTQFPNTFQMTFAKNILFRRYHTLCAAYMSRRHLMKRKKLAADLLLMRCIFLRYR